ncbi:6-pyruvoyl-tetrahydropterin synthase-related protein [Anaerolineales bacterium HSG24]|nr:6-pyruvoyl-tetrahydropterin synthase-related protein [Anaerolineales bacterium HSG24]
MIHQLSTIIQHIICIVPRLFKQFEVGLLLVMALSMLIIQPFLQPGLPTTADIPIHLFRTLEYGQAWSDGVILPHWSPNLAFGYGYPLFLFAPPVPYWIGLFFYWLGFSLEVAFKLLIIVTILLYATGGYLLGRDGWRSSQSGLISGTAYAFAPFALRESLLYGGNVPQYLAIALFPWVLWPLLRAAQTPAWGWILLSGLFYALILLSHLFHALIFSPVLAFFGILLLIPTWHGQTLKVSKIFRVLRPIFYFLGPIPLGLLLSAFFWIPAFIERYNTRAQADIYLEKSPFFIRYPHWTELLSLITPLDSRAANPHVPLTLGLATVTLAGLSLLAILAKECKVYFADTWRAAILTAPQAKQTLHPSPTILALFFLTIALSAIYLTLPMSQIVWETVTILQVAEFPWRLLGLANLGLSFLAGGAILLAPIKWRWHFTVVCLIWQIWLVAPFLYSVTSFTLYGTPTLADQIRYERRSQSIGTTTLGEYLPHTVQIVPTGSPLVPLFEAGQTPARLDDNILPDGTTVTLINQSAVSHQYQIDTPTETLLRLWQYDYPGWRAMLDGQPVPIMPEAETGFITMQIPAGLHAVQFDFGLTPIRLSSLLISSLTAVLFILIMGYLIMGHRWMVRGMKLAPSPIRTDSNLTPIHYLLLIMLLLVILLLKPRLRPMFSIESPPHEAIPAQHPTTVQFEQGIHLLGYDLSSTVLSAGERLEVVLYWETNQAPIKANLQPFVHLDRLNDMTTLAETTNYTPGDMTTESVLPTFHWEPGRYVRDKHALTVPSDALPIAYALRVGLLDPDQHGARLPLSDGSNDTAFLTMLNITDSATGWFDFVTESPTPQLLDVTFLAESAHISLTGFSIEPIQNERLDFRLYWQTDQPIHADYTIFAQLLTVDNQLVASFDAPPFDGAYPTSTWLPHQPIIDPHHIPLTNVLAGEYRLVVGLYQPETGQRLWHEHGSDFVELSSVIVGNEE